MFKIIALPLAEIHDRSRYYRAEAVDLFRTERGAVEMSEILNRKSREKGSPRRYLVVPA